MKIIERMDIAGQNSWWGARMLISLVEFQSRNILRLLFPSIKTSIKLCDKKCERLILSLSSPEWWHSMRSSWCPSASWWSSQVRSHNISPVLYLDDNKEFIRKDNDHHPVPLLPLPGAAVWLQKKPLLQVSIFYILKGNIISWLRVILVLHTNYVQDNVPWVASLYGGPGLQPQVPWLCQEYHLQGGFKCWNILNQSFVLKGMNTWISTQRLWLKILPWKWPKSLVQNWHISVQGVAFISNLAPAMEAQQWSKRRFDQQERSICDSVCYPRYLNFINQNTASCSN